jgi:hypothetical protein
MNHKELVDRAVRWLRSRHSCSVVFAEMTTAVSETPDVIGWYRFTSHVVEVKVSRSDFHRDRGKIHVRAGQSMGQFRWYLTPPGLLKVDDLPPGYGLAEVRGARTFIVREAEPRNDRAVNQEIQLLVSAVQRAHLGVQFDHETARWESYAKGRARLREEQEDLKKPVLASKPSQLRTLSDEEMEEVAKKMQEWGEAMTERTKGMD